MTDKPTPTDADLKAMWQLHAADIGGIFHYARAVLAKWGQPAQAAEPVALLVRKNSWRDGQWEAAPPNSPSYGREWASQRVYVYTTPQPTHAQAVPLPKFLALKFHARRDKKATVTLLFPGHEAADAWVRGIKGGQHGTDN